MPDIKKEKTSSSAEKGVQKINEETAGNERVRSELDDLEFVRTFDFRHIPRELFEQIEEMDPAMIDRLYTFGGQFSASPLTLLYVLVDVDYKIKGVLWANIDIIEGMFFIRLLSLNKEYQSLDGQFLSKIKDFLFNLETGPALKKKIQFLTSKPKAYEKAGCQRSKQILMEIDNGKNNKDRTKRDNTSDPAKPVKS